MTIMNNDDLVINCMEMIGHTGEGRSQVYEAVAFMIDEDYEKALDRLAKAEDELSKAHSIQFQKLMAEQAKGIEIPNNLLLLHALDILMVSTAEKDMIKAIVTAKLSRVK